MQDVIQTAVEIKGKCQSGPSIRTLDFRRTQNNVSPHRYVHGTNIKEEEAEQNLKKLSVLVQIQEAFFVTFSST